jgi:hypothetical protein
LRSPGQPIAILVLTVAFAMATLAFGWWVVFVVGAVWAAIVRKSDQPIRVTAGAATAGWVGLLVFTGSAGPVGQLAGLFGLVLPLPMAVLYVPTLVAGGAIASGGALLVSAVQSREEWTGEDRRRSPDMAETSGT